MPERNGRRGFLRSGIAGAALSIPVRQANAAVILAVRVWPAQDYTRVTLELDRPLKYRFQLLPNPSRLVVDLNGVDIDGEIRDLIAKIKPDDPYIAGVRVGQHKPSVVRIVFDLKADVLPQLFNLDPVANYKHRLVIDLHPSFPTDPLIALLKQQQTDQDRSASTAVLGSQADAERRRFDPLASLIKKSEGIKRGTWTKKPGRTRQVKRPSRTKGANAPIRRLVTIAIDAGHGGEDPGASGRHGTREKDVVLAIAAELRQMIRMEPGLRAFMTREGDYFVPLAQRVAKASRVAADLFVSIHADAFVRPDARGASVYVLSNRGATSTTASWLARKENLSDLIGGVRSMRPVRNRQARKLLVEMSARRKTRESNLLGKRVLRELNQVAHLHKPNLERAGFAVLKTPDIPAILVETAFISNPSEERRLNDPRYQRKIARAIFNGLRTHLRVSGPSSVKRA